MKFAYIFIFITIHTLLLSFAANAQENYSETRVLFINNFSAKDYYTLKNADPKELVFEIVEACIPGGFIAIRFEKGYDDKASRDYTQTIVLRLISKNANHTAYSIEDMRKFCADFRKENSDD